MKIELSDREVTVLVNALLPWYSVDINIDMDIDDEFFDLAKRLQDEFGNVDTSELYLCKGGVQDQPDRIEKVLGIFDIEER